MVGVPRAVIALMVFSMLFSTASNLVRVQAIRGDLGTAIASFSNPGEAYREAQLLAQMDRDGVGVANLAGYSWAFRISTVLGVFNGLYFPLALVCWRRLQWWHKLLFFGALFCSLLFTVGLGTQSGIGFLLFVSVPVVIYSRYRTADGGAGRTGSDPSGRRVGGLGWLKTMVVGAMAAAILVGVVAFFQISRAEDRGVEFDASRDVGREYNTPMDSGLLRPTGGRLNYGLVMASIYVSHGYEGLALAMELPFEWTYGLGWSKALTTIYHDYLGGPDLFERTYLGRNGSRNNWTIVFWSTIFPWIASDTTYYGTWVVMLLIGAFLGRCWIDALTTGNPVAFAVLGQLFTLIFMFPANDALAQTLEQFFSLVGVLLLYAWSRSYLGQAAPQPLHRGVGRWAATRWRGRTAGQRQSPLSSRDWRRPVG